MENMDGIAKRIPTSSQKQNAAEDIRSAFREDCDRAEERYLLETLRILDESYAKAARPYMERLVSLRNRRFNKKALMVPTPPNTDDVSYPPSATEISLSSSSA